MELPSVCIVLYTYEDGERQTAPETLCSALDRLGYSGPLHVHIADDGSIPGHVDQLREIAAGYPHVQSVGASNAQRSGYGRSYNLATQQTHPHHSIFLALEDDWRLSRPLDIDPLVETLTRTNGIDCIRLGYLGFTQPIRGDFAHTPGGVMALLDPASMEPHVFAGHPRIETVEFQRRVGPWLEGLPAGQTEFDVSTRDDARRGVAWPADLIPPRGGLFEHIGAHELGELQP